MTEFRALSGRGRILFGSPLGILFGRSRPFSSVFRPMRTFFKNDNVAVSENSTQSKGFIRAMRCDAMRCDPMRSDAIREAAATEAH